MTLEDAKQILLKNNIDFYLLEFSNEAEYWHHSIMFPYTNNARKCKVVALIIPSKNGQKNIELQFNLNDNSYFFEDLHFGDFSFEMYNYKEEYIAGNLLKNIQLIMNGTFKIIVVNDLKRSRWLGDACFDVNNDEDDILGKQGFQKAIADISKPKSFISKLTKSKTLYEIFDWNTYQKIEK